MCTFTSTPADRPKVEYARRAKLLARSACDPDTVTASETADAAHPTTDDHARGFDADAEAPEPARSEAHRIEHPEVQAGRGGDDDLGHVRSAT